MNRWFKAAVRWTCHLTHTGDALGFAASNKSATLADCSVATISQQS